jgi:hypothetical protein
MPRRPRHKIVMRTKNSRVCSFCSVDAPPRDAFISERGMVIRHLSLGRFSLHAGTAALNVKSRQSHGPRRRSHRQPHGRLDPLLTIEIIAGGGHQQEHHQVHGDCIDVHRYEVHASQRFDSFLGTRDPGQFHIVRTTRNSALPLSMRA